MVSELEVTRRHFISDCHNHYELEKIALEDCKFTVFTDLLDEADIFKSPQVARKNGTFKNGKWSLIGFSCNSIKFSSDDEDEAIELNDIDTIDSEPKTDELEFHWEYTLFNGFFNDEQKISKATKQEITRSVKEIARFIEKTLQGDLVNDVCETRDLQEHLLEQFQKTLLSSLDICIITDTIIDQENLDNSLYLESVGINCRVYYWDLKKWNELRRSKSKRIPIVIDFTEEDYKIYNVHYLKSTINEKLSHYLAVFPGDLLADLYDYHKTKLLENNVRVFLSANRKANKAIRTTIGDSPEKFFSYNNGISATAESVTIENDRIVLINDFQIVNGGQTTATIHYSRSRDKKSLKDVLVPVKITSLKKDEEYAPTVSNISRAANTQSAIKASDFFANDPMLIEIERFTSKNPATDQSNRNIYYFFERMTGQYNVIKNSNGTNKSIQKWEKSHPKSLSFNKIDIARWSNCMAHLPHIAALSAEKQFTNFMDEKNFERAEISFGRFKTLVGFGLLFSRARKLCGTKNGKEYPSIIGDSSVGMATTIYAMSYLHLVSKGQIDYWGIYDYKYDISLSLTERTRIQTAFDRVLEDVIRATWKSLAQFGGTSVQEQTKQLDCWKYVKNNAKLIEKSYSELSSLIISQNEKAKRETVEINDEDAEYFNSLNTLLKDRGKIAQLMSQITVNQSRFKSNKASISNLIKKINSGQKTIIKKRVGEYQKFYEELRNRGLINNDVERLQNQNTLIEEELNILEIFNRVFKNKNQFISQFENYIVDHEKEFDTLEKLYEDCIDVIEKYYREYGLSIDDFRFLNKVMMLMDK